jgi:hypothetical protein
VRVAIYRLCVIKIIENEVLKSAHWEPSCSMRTEGRSHRHDEANSRFSLF